MRWPVWLGIAVATLGAAALATHVQDAPRGAQVGSPSATSSLYALLVLAGLGLLVWGVVSSEEA